MTKIQICMVASEVAPFAKTGGLADVAAGLTRYLAASGHDVRLFMPLYGSVRAGGWDFRPEPELQDVPVSIGGRDLTFSVSTAVLPGSEARVYFVRNPELYGGDKIYTDGADEYLRFAFLVRAVLETCQQMQWGPDVFHCNDWHTALLPLYLKTRYAWDQLFTRSRSVLSIHNIGYQGVFSSEVLPSLDLEQQQHLLDESDTEAGILNFLRTGVAYADVLATVSRTYADEIQTSAFGMGLDEQLRHRRSALCGIVNGVDYGDWNPANDPLIAHHFDCDDLAGKAANKAALLRDFDLDEGHRVPVLGVVSRLTQQKGLDLLAEVLPVLLQQRRIRFIALGTGERVHERFLQWLRDTFPDQVGFYRGYDNALAHRIEAGADIFLMPSRYEPCGLNQMYSLKYGTVPVVRRTGGLADTVANYDPETGSGTGFTFDDYDSAALLTAIERALAVFADEQQWRALMMNGMARDFSWDVQGPEYVELYRGLMRGV